MDVVKANPEKPRDNDWVDVLGELIRGTVSDVEEVRKVESFRIRPNVARSWRRYGSDSEFSSAKLTEVALLGYMTRNHVENMPWVLKTLEEEDTQ